MFPELFILLILSTFLLISESATLGKKIPVPDNDSKLQDLIYRSALQRTNNELRNEKMWWVSVSGASLGATKVTVSVNGRLYTTYDFTLTSTKSICKRNATPYASIKKCSADKTSSDRQSCRVVAALFENDKDNVEMETYCTIHIASLSKGSSFP